MKNETLSKEKDTVLKNEFNTKEINQLSEGDAKNSNNLLTEWTVQKTSQFVNRYGMSNKKIVKKILEDPRRDGVALLDPKVNEPYEPIPRRMTRKDMIAKIKSIFSTVNIEELLKKQNIDFSHSNTSKLSLHYFDNKLFDIYPNESWMNRAIDQVTGKQLKLQAQCLFMDKKTKLGQWKRVLISSYDKITDTFSGYTDDAQKIPFENMQKIYLLIDSENPYIFTKRIVDAIKYRELAESRIKYNYYLSKIPTDELEALSELRLQKIFKKSKFMNDLDMIEDKAYSEINEINRSYLQSLAKIVFDDLYFVKKSPELCCFNLKLPQENKPKVPKFGKEMVHQPDFNFRELQKSFEVKSIFSKRNVIEALEKIKNINNKMVTSMYLYKTKFNRTLKFDEFRREQRLHFTNFKLAIEQEEIGEIKNLLQKISIKSVKSDSNSTNEKFEVDFGTQKINKKKKFVFPEDEQKQKYLEAVISKMNEFKTNNMINMINTMMQDTMYYVLCNSLIEYLNFFENFIPADVSVMNTHTVKNDFTRNSEIFPKIKNITKHFNTINLDNTAFGVLTSDFLSHEIDLNTTNDLINFSTKEEENLKDGNSRLPIFHIALKFKENQFGYSYPLEDLINEVKKLFDEGLEKVQKIPLISLKHNQDYTGLTKVFEIVQRDKNIISKKEILNAEQVKLGHHITAQNIKENSEWVSQLYERLGNSLLLGKDPLKKFLETFEMYKTYLNIIPEQHIKSFEFEDGTESGQVVQKLREDVIHIKKLNEKILGEIKEEIQVGYFLVNCREIRDILMQKFEKIIELEIDMLVVISRKIKQSINKQCEEIKKEISKPTKTIDELVAIERYIEEVPNMLEKIQLEIDECMSIYKVLDEFLYKVQFLELRQRYMLIGAPTDILNTISTVKNLMQKQRDKFLEELLESQRKLKEEMGTIVKSTTILLTYSSIQNLTEAAHLARTLESMFQDCKDKSKIFNIREVHFGREQTNYSKLQEMYKEFEPFYQIWSNIDIFENKTKFFLTEDLQVLKGSDVKLMNENVIKNLNNSIRKLRDKDSQFSKIVETAEVYKKKAEEFRPISNLAEALTTEGMQERHWEELKEKTGIDCVSREGLCLETVIASITEQSSDKISKEIIANALNISDKATKEFRIEKTLNDLEERWVTINFTLSPYKGTFTVGGWGDIYNFYDEDVAEVQQLEINQFKGPFINLINNWSQAFININIILDSWRKFQKMWMHLQPIFESPDINKAIPTQAKHFLMADKNWREQIKSIRENPNVKQFCTKEGLVKILYDSNVILEDVEAKLNDYIEKKKGIFPRFYFLANQDLIEIISQTKDLTKIKDNLKKIFENIHYIELKDDKIITHMLSNLKESVPLRDLVLIQGKNVETWMGDLEKSMFATVKSCFEKAMNTYVRTKREQWIFDHPGQCVMHSQQLHWTNQVEEAINKKRLEKYVQDIQERINILVKIVRGPLSRVNGITISNLITLEVHNKEVTNSLLENNVQDVFSFEWIKQLRYYWEKNDCWVKSIQTSFPYGYEYLGNTEILVITPLTDKCYLTLMGAIKFNKGGAPAGPAGTGKTESTKDLAKAIAKQCIVFNCSDETDSDTASKFFKGLACCGAWICFDEFNRINIEVLSVIAQLLIQLFRAKEKNDDLEITFEKSLIRILPTFCVFITMNPDYEGRTALPDNLIALFRPMAMMVPDYRLISEVYLYSCGYFSAEVLAKKIVSTFKLSSEQLSTQFHYDFGMRAVKSVLYAAKKLKRQFPEINEDQLLLQAIEDVNVPKFLKEDIPLFQNIMKDLFPTTERPKSDLEVLVNQIKINCQKMNLKPASNFIKKIIQLYDTLQVRHGLMLVGPTGAGKTSNWKVLQKSLSDLDDGQRFYKTEAVVINPKSIRKGQVYCELDEKTQQEYLNGVLPINILSINQDNSTKTKYWIMFDGPVDTLWIEDMNSVLDDSRRLCLQSSAIIVLNESISMMFEAEDLVHASPATVSRCGMVYMEPAAIGLTPIVESWLDRLPSNLRTASFDVCKAFKDLFDKYLINCVSFVRKNLKESCPTTDNNLAESLLRLLDCLLEKFKDKESNKVTDIDVEILYKSLPQIFFYAVIWSLGITCKEDGRAKFDKYVRELITENFPNDHHIPAEGLVYDYYFDMEKENDWIKWDSILHFPSIDLKSSYTDIIIPTIDSVRYSYTIKLLMTNNKHLITTGPTGTGKTVNIIDVIGKGLGDKFSSLFINFSAQTSSNQTQETIDLKLRKKNRMSYFPDGNKTMVIFVDDLNMPKKEKYDAQPPIELLRQWLEYGGWYNQSDKEKPFMDILNLIFVGAMGPPGGGRSYLSNRFMRHFNLITYTELVDTSIKSIFERKVNHFLGRFPEGVRQVVPHIISSTLDLYKEIKSKLLPIPKTSHYLFNLRDMSKVLQGVCSASMKHTTKKIDIIRLWMHEMARSFCDRLISDEDRKWLNGIIEGKILSVKELGVNSLEDLYGSLEKIIFCDFAGGADTDYVQVTNIKQFITKIEDYLVQFNVEPQNKPMHLVMFLDACDHVARICRIIRQTQGHALLLGVGGSGRQSLARLSSYINRMDCKQIEVTKGYDMKAFKNNLKDILKSCGVSEKPSTFLMCDTQIFNELILENINNCLNSGDVPDLYKPEDLEEIRAACRMECRMKNLPETNTNISNVYLNRVRSNIHIIMAMSPVGEIFVTRLRMFPSLVNCCTIDWFTEWPDEALQSVAKDTLERNEMDLGDSIAPCIETIKFIHKSVEKASVNYLQEVRRYNYLTPTSFLEFLILFQKFLHDKKEENNYNTNRLETGLNVLQYAGEKIEEIETAIKQKQPILEETTIKVNNSIKYLEVNKAEADVVKREALEERIKAEELSKEINQLDAACQEALDKAEKELRISLNKIRDINENDLRQIANVSNLSDKLRKVIELLLIFKTGNAFRTRQANMKHTGDIFNPYELSYLMAAKNELNTNDVGMFKAYFFSFENEDVRENLKNKEMFKVQLAKEFIEKESIDRRFVEQAANSIVSCFEFIVAMIDFCEKSINIVDPMKKEAAKARSRKLIADETLRNAEDKLSQSERKLNELESEYNSQMKYKNDLAFEISENQTKLERAKKIVDLLSGEKQRWAENVVTLKKSAENLVGDCLIAAASIAYSGAFTSDYRTMLTEQWRLKLDFEKIKRSVNVNLREVMEDKLQTRKWNIYHLPNDNLSIENGIIMFRTRRWPLMIDPQNQASIFLKKYGYSTRDTSFQIVKASDPKMIDQVISGVKFGYWILLDNLGLSLDTSLEPVLLQQKVKVRNYWEIRIGDKVIPYNDDFKLFMITKISNPHYSPETFAKITIINFAITKIGLEDQMLAELIKIEMPELEETKNKILEENFKSQEILKEIEDKMLDTLSKNRNNIEECLRSADLIEILTEAKSKSMEINEQMKISEQAVVEINAKREIYRPSALRSSLLFFTLLDLAFIDPMYQYSLNGFKRIFDTTVRYLIPSEDIKQRITIINKKFTKDYYDFTCRSLFEKDKLLFTFLMVCQILMGEQKISCDKKIDPLEFRFLLAGPSGDMEITYPENPTTWISQNDWRTFYSQIYGMSKLNKSMGDIEPFFMKNHNKFKEYYDSPKNEFTLLPEPFESNLTDFQKLILVKAVRSDKLINCILQFVEKNLGKEFTEAPSFDLEKSYRESNFAIPLLFVLSTGSDPQSEFIQLAESEGRKCEFVSLGRAMDKVALSKIEDMKLKGGWVILQNCHLALSFMPKLEDAIEQLQNNGVVDQNFRLWLTSMSSKDFSINVLKNSIKITMEPPKGLKANLQRQFANIKDEELQGSTKPELFKTFFFSLCFFHAIVQDRRKFGPIGWNVKYDFTNEDLKVSRLQLKNFLEEYDEIPYKVLNFLGAEINYGGRVTDDKDQRLIKTILNGFLTPKLLDKVTYKFSDSGTYYCPVPGSKADYLAYIKSLPANTSPEVFGMHENAEIITAQNEAGTLLETILGMQPRTSASTGKSSDELVSEILKTIEQYTPEVFDYEGVFKKYQTEYTESMNTVLIQEVIRYNNLLAIIKKHIDLLKRAMSGRIVMSDEMDRIATSLYNNQVPQIWIKSGFLSLKPLMSWAQDLKERIEFFSNWIATGTPKAFCLSSNYL